MKISDKKTEHYELDSIAPNSNGGIYNSIVSSIKCGRTPEVSFSGVKYVLSKVGDDSIEFTSVAGNGSILVVAADDSVTKNDLNLVIGDYAETMNSYDSSFVKVICSDDLIRGTITSSGYNDNLTQVCTRSFIPVKKGDQIVLSCKKGNDNIQYKYAFYDTTKSYVSISSWSALNTLGAGGNNAVIPADGFIKIALTKYNQETITTRAQIEYFDKSVVLLRFGFVDYFECGFTEKIKKVLSSDYRLALTDGFVEQGYWDYVSNAYVKKGNAARCRSSYEMVVHAGDIIFVTDTAYKINIGISDPSTGVRQYYYGPTYGILVPVDGLLHITIRATSNANFTPSDVAGKVVIFPAVENEKDVYVSNASELAFGMYGADDMITLRSDRICNIKPIAANKGDILICNRVGLAINVREVYRSNNTRAVSPSAWFTSLAEINQLEYGIYEVQTDGVYLNCVLYSYSGALSGNIEDYADCIKVVRRSKYKDFAATTPNTPLSSRKGRVIPSTLYLMQDGSFVGDKLWVSEDSYNESDPGVVKVIDPSDGSVIKTISHDFGHNGIADYCEETDTILNVIPGDDVIYLHPNVSGITTSYTKSECVQIDLNTLFGIRGSGNCGCFGENKQTIYICKGYQLATDTIENKIYKIWLEMVDGEYTGNASLIATYNGTINGLMGDYGTQSQLWSAQSCKYDGYIYLAYGTHGHNFFLVDLDDKTLTWRPVGRIAYEYFTADHTKKYLEPEFIAIRGNKIVTGSRDYSEQISSVVEFERGF